MNKLTQNLKNFLPHPFKQGLKYIGGAVPLPVRYGPTFNRQLSFLKESQWWSREDLERYQAEQLGRVLKHAYDHVPFYYRLFKQLSLKPEDFSRPGILREIPFLDKDTVLENLPDLIATDRRRMIYLTTGGTSGKQLKIYADPANRVKEQAFIHDLWSRVGYDFHSRRAVLRGKVIRTDHYPRTWKYDPWRKELLLSTYDMTDENLSLYIEKIKEYRTEFIHCYPSTITVLAKFVKKYDINDFPPIKAVLATSENTYPGQREFVEETLKTRYVDLYGHVEQLVLAGECEVNSQYHIYPQYGYTEIIGPDDKEVTEDGGRGEIIGTGFINTVMPLIRYRTGDWAIVKKGWCSCGRKYPLLEKVEGRWHQDMIVGKRGNLISIAAINTHSDVYDRVRQYQFWQERPGQIILKVVKDKEYRDDDTSRIVNYLKERFAGDVDVIIEFVNEISRTGRGKFKYLIQKLSQGLSP
jgi:phenylacetate-coenzyme A ligase PaaK-like adenylate-forming protein